MKNQAPLAHNDATPFAYQPSLGPPPMTRMPQQYPPPKLDDGNLVSVGGCPGTPVWDCNGLDPTFRSAGACVGKADPIDICQNLRLKTYEFKFHELFDESPHEAEDPFASSGKDSQSVCQADKVLTFVKSLHESDGEFDMLQCSRNHDVQPNEAALGSLSKFGKRASCSPNLALNGAKSPCCCRPARQASATSAYSCLLHNHPQ